MHAIRRRSLAGDGLAGRNLVPLAELHHSRGERRTAERRGEPVGQRACFVVIAAMGGEPRFCLVTLATNKGPNLVTCVGTE